ncbi:MAG: hypothetical protein KIT84_08785 [Labilithrix sp.]|nr:hypothetical protein [Labilithrix sp.]MCW5811094.1 hypothetical protein [Labilithrix sp.]
MRFAVVVAWLAVACAGPAASFDGTTYRKGPVAFTLPAAPAGWTRLDVSDASLAWRDDVNHASILVNARCRGADQRTPLVALTNQLVIGSTERDYESQQPEPFDGREALHTVLRAKWDGVPMKADVFVLSKDGCTYDFVYIGAPDRFDAGAPAFESFVRAFRTLPGSGLV